MHNAHPNNHLSYRLFPFLSWRHGYNLASFRGDPLAGLTVATVLIPQAMAYAMLAGLPPVYGIYAAAALIIISTQLPHFLGFTVARHEYIFSMLLELFQKLPGLHMYTVVIGSASFVLIYSLKKYRFHPKEIVRLWRMNHHDGVVAATVFLLAFLTKPDYALLIGVIVSLVLFLWNTMHPRIVRVTKDPAHNMFVNADVHALPGCPQILHLRPDSVIFFANAEYTVEHIWGYVDKQRTPLKFLLLDFQAIGFIDLTAIDELRALSDEIEQQGTALSFLSVHLPVKTVLQSSGLLDDLGADCVIEENREDAIWCLFQHLDHDYCKDTCPHTLFMECNTVK